MGARTASATGGDRTSAGRRTRLDGRFTVQVGAFSEPERAASLQQSIARLYPQAAVHSDGTWNRVQIGSFDDRESAETLRGELAAQGFSAIVVNAP